MGDFAKNTELVAASTALFLIGIGAVQVVLGEVVSRSVALTANGIDCIGDGFVSTVVWVGLRFVKRPADHKFHYGYYKIENLASIAAAIVMFILAGYIVYRSYLQFVDPHPIQLPIVGAIVAVIAAVIAVILGVVKYREGKETNLSSIKLEAFNTVKDGMASALTVMALLLASYGYPAADPVVGIIIAGVIVTIGFAAIKEASYTLVDGCDASCLDQRLLIQNLITEYDAVHAARMVRLRRSGPVIQGEIELGVSAAMTIAEFEELKHTIEEKIRDEIPEFEQLTITAAVHEEDESDP